jgi:hypothetical protein
MSTKQAGLMTFSEEEDKLYADGFDPLYMAENDKKPVLSPHFSKSDEDQEVKPTKKIVVGASDESKDDLNDKEPPQSPLFSQSDDDQKVKLTKRSVGPSDEPKDDLNFDNMSFLLSEAIVDVRRTSKFVIIKTQSLSVFRQPRTSYGRSFLVRIISGLSEYIRRMSRFYQKRTST